MTGPGGSGFTKLGERTIHEGHVITLAVGTFEGPDGEPFEREVVHHPGAVAVVPLLDDGRTVILVRQYRSALDDLLLELPAGKLDVPGEPPEAAAARELEEEIGYRAGRSSQLGRAPATRPASATSRARSSWPPTSSRATASAQGVEEAAHDHRARAAAPRRWPWWPTAASSDAKTIIGLLLARDQIPTLSS